MKNTLSILVILGSFNATLANAASVSLEVQLDKSFYNYDREAASFFDYYKGLERTLLEKKAALERNLELANSVITVNTQWIKIDDGNFENSTFDRKALFTVESNDRGVQIIVHQGETVHSRTRDIQSTCFGETEKVKANTQVLIAVPVVTDALFGVYCRTDWIEVKTSGTQAN